MLNCNKSGCHEKPVYLSKFCWFHMPQDEKSTYNSILIDKLKEERTVEGENFRLAILKNLELPPYVAIRECDFTKADLSNSILQRIDFRDCKFENAIINDSHFEFSDFRGLDTSFRDADVRATHFNGALLQNVDFTNADLRDAILIDADMIGAMLSNSELYAARLLNTRLRKENFSNFIPTKIKLIRTGDEYSRDKAGRDLTPLRARYVYSILKNNFRSIGEYADERWARFKEREMERKRLFQLGFLADRYSDAIAIERWRPEDKDKLFESRKLAIIKWLYRWFLTILGYGESPFRFLFMSIVTIILFAFLFMFFGFEYSASNNSILIGRDLIFVPSEIAGTIYDLKTSLYMSIVTFTTLGYGDAHPVGGTRMIASAEALLGFLAYSSFVATFLKRLSDE